MPFAVIGTDQNKLLEFEKDIFDTLLMDKTTKRNIIWATNDYEALGVEYHSESPVKIEFITGNHAGVIQPRISKARHSQINRTKEKAEVFTPAWICNEQNNLIDYAWFGKENVFNSSMDKKWRTNKKQILFREKRGATWKDYVDAKRIEIACGEAPYLTSRYDMLSGNYIQVPRRIGLLDRKLRVVNENTSSLAEWERWAVRALESIYGFEFQGDNLLIARENILFTFIEHMQYKLGRDPSIKTLKKAANVIAWNIWQMDGLTNTVPFGSMAEQYRQMTLGNCKLPEGQVIYCKVRDWRSKKTFLFESLFKDEV